MVEELPAGIEAVLAAGRVISWESSPVALGMAPKEIDVLQLLGAFQDQGIELPGVDLELIDGASVSGVGRAGGDPGMEDALAFTIRIKVKADEEIIEGDPGYERPDTSIVFYVTRLGLEVRRPGRSYPRRRSMKDLRDYFERNPNEAIRVVSTMLGLVSEAGNLK